MTTAGGPASARWPVPLAVQVERLLAAGCLDRRLDRLAALPQVVACREELGGYAVPPSIVHGDLHMGNVARGPAGYRFLDWTDACVAHPFFDVATIRRGTDDAVDDDLRDRLRAAYLPAWASFEPHMSRSTAWWLRQVLAGLSLAG